MSADTIAATAAFLSGVGAVLGAGITLKKLRRQMHKDCEERIQALKEGIAIGEHLEEKP